MKTDDSNIPQLQLEKTIGIDHNPDNHVSGGPIENFDEGWAVMPSGEKAHFWKDNGSPIRPFRRWKSLCGVDGSTSDMWPPLHLGSFQKCKRCQKLKASRR